MIDANSSNVASEKGRNIHFPLLNLNVTFFTIQLMFTCGWLYDALCRAGDREILQRERFLLVKVSLLYQGDLTGIPILNSH